MDNGAWYLMVFNTKEMIAKLNINEHFKIDNNTIPIAGFAQPFATCCFMDNNEIYYNFFYKDTKTHYHFTYDPIAKEVKQDIHSFEISNCTVKNFPQKVFYSQKKREISSFYRQGYNFEISADDIKSY